MPLTQETAKVMVWPIDHFTGARLSWRGWQATLGAKGSDNILASCEHVAGHRTVEAAKACGVKMWKRLPNA